MQVARDMRLSLYADTPAAPALSMQVDLSFTRKSQARVPEARRLRRRTVDVVTLILIVQFATAPRA